MEDDINFLSNEGIQVFKQLKYFEHLKHQRNFSNLGNIYVVSASYSVYSLSHSAGNELGIALPQLVSVFIENVLLRIGF